MTLKFVERCNCGLHTSIQSKASVRRLDGGKAHAKKIRQRDHCQKISG